MPKPLSHFYSLSHSCSIFISPLSLVSSPSPPSPYRIKYGPLNPCSIKVVTNYPILKICPPLMYAVATGHGQEYRADRVAAICNKSYAQGGIRLMETHIELESLLR